MDKMTHSQMGQYYQTVSEIIFKRLDKNKDNILDEVEFDPYLEELMPEESQRRQFFYAFFWVNGTNSKDLFAQQCFAAREFITTQVWSLIDSDKNDCMSENEFKTRYCPILMRFSDFNFNIHDMNGDGLLEKQEYFIISHSLGRSFVKTEMNWKIADINRSGQMTKEQMREYTKLMVHPI